MLTRLLFVRHRRLAQGPAPLGVFTSTVLVHTYVHPFALFFVFLAIFCVLDLERVPVHWRGGGGKLLACRVGSKRQTIFANYILSL